MPALFIDIRVADDASKDGTLAKKLEEVCPVGIFVATDAGVEISEENLDECTLCDLCLEAAPKGTVRVIKRYEE